MNQKVKLLEHLKKHNSSKEQINKFSERLLQYNKLKGQSVEVLNIINNETSFYSSILFLFFFFFNLWFKKKAAEAIGCVHSTILLADKAFKEKEFLGL